MTGPELKQTRLSRGWTQVYASDYFGISVRMWKHWENNPEFPPPKWVDRYFSDCKDKRVKLAGRK